MKTTYTRDQLKTELVRALNGKLTTAVVKIRFATMVIGGQPAGDAGIAAFVKHQLELTGDDATAAIARIKKEELTDTPEDVTPADGEFTEEKTYGLNVLRRTDLDYAYIGTWQIRAMLKQAASRIGFFVQKHGAKGDLSEGMLVRPYGASLVGEGQQVVLLVDGKPYAAHVFKKFMGSVSSAKGKVSIVHDSETAPAGCEIEFTVEWPSKLIKPKNMAAIFGLAERVGLGSVRSMEYGRFEVVSLEIETPDGYVEEAEGEEETKPAKGKKKGKVKAVKAEAEFKPGPGEILENAPVN